MRLSTAGLSQLGINAILDQQAQLLRTQLQLSAGQRILQPSDDPSGATLSLQLQSAIDKAERFQKNAVLVEARLSLEETTLSRVGDALQRIRQLTVQANNDSQTDESRASIAVELRQRLDGLVQLANTQAANGEYLFAGLQSLTRPFTVDNTGVTYQGDDSVRLVPIGAERQVAIGHSGSEVFEDIPAGNGTFTVAVDPANTGSGVIGTGSVVDDAAWAAAPPGDYVITFTAPDQYQVVDAGNNVVAAGAYEPGTDLVFAGIQVRIQGQPAQDDRFTIAPAATQGLFTTVGDLIKAIDTPSPDADANARFHTAMNVGLTNLDQAIGKLLNVRAEVGARLNAIDNQNSIHQDWVVQLKSTQSSIQDFDYAEAISRFQRQLTGLQAAQLAYTKVQGLSLFDYLR